MFNSKSNIATTALALLKFDAQMNVLPLTERAQFVYQKRVCAI